MDFIKVGDEVDAVVRVMIFGSHAYQYRKVNFTIEEITEHGKFRGVSTHDGSEAIFPLSQIKSINGMDISRYKICETKEGAKETKETA